LVQVVFHGVANHGSDGGRCLLSPPFYGARGEEEADPRFILASRSVLILVLVMLMSGRQSKCGMSDSRR